MQFGSESVKRNIALIAHDRMKDELAEWVSLHSRFLKRHQLYATATTAGVLMEAISDLTIMDVKSGPLGGD